MSYIILGTEYEDPSTSKFNMDLIDIKNIYQGKINNYFLTKLKAIDYYEL